MNPPFDPDAAAAEGSGIFGLPFGRGHSAVVLVPVPFDATVSYGSGTAAGPAAILAASHQVDLYDLQTGRSYERGIHMLAPDSGIGERSEAARALAAPIIARGGARAEDPTDIDAVARVDALCAEVHDRVEAAVSGILAEGRIPGVVGGDHSVSLGALRAVGRECRSRGVDFGVLQIDAHADLRDAFEGFRYSHASIMHNALAEVPEIARLVQVGIRDVGEGEVLRAAQDPRVLQHQDLAWRQRLARGGTLQELLDEAVAGLPEEVYVSFDIDGLDPSLCPGTGTPVPGGLLFHEACLLLEALVRSGRRILGFDVTEVAPRAGDEWDANVGARILYKLCSFAILARESGGTPGEA